MTNCKQAGKQGFTMIEVLIVVVIIGALAALIIPRMTGSPEKAKMAEAYEMLGALTRAQQARMDTTGITTPANFASCNYVVGACTLPASLGMKDIQQKNFWYSCAGSMPDPYCYAVRFYAGDPYILRYYGTTQIWDCEQGYVTANGGVAGASTQGCKPNW